MVLGKNTLNNRIFQKFVRILKEHARFTYLQKIMKKGCRFFELESFEVNCKIKSPTVEVDPATFGIEAETTTTEPF